MMDFTLLRDRLDVVERQVGQLRLMLDNVEAGDTDGERYVVLDNLRRMPVAIGRTHYDLGRFSALVEQAEEAAAGF